MSTFAMIHRRDGENKLPPELGSRGRGLLYGHALAKAWDEMHQIARAIRATSLHKFYYEESEADYDEELYEQLNMAPPKMKAGSIWNRFTWKRRSSAIWSRAPAATYSSPPTNKRLRSGGRTDVSILIFAFLRW